MRDDKSGASRLLWLRALLGLLLPALLAAAPGAAEILRLEAAGSDTRPARFCLTGPEAEFSWTPGQAPRLVPERGLFSFFPQGQAPLWPRVHLPTEVPRGETIRGLLVLAEGLEGLEASLEGDGGESRAPVPGFPLEAQGRSWAVLLGVESTARAGERRLVLRGWRGEREFELHASVRILHREFESESIAFNQALSELMTIADPRKEEEHRRLRSILERHDRGAFFHPGALIVPVKATRRTSGFADRRLYRYTDGGSSRSLHNGVDLAAPVGTPVAASGAGRVVMAADRLLSGLTVVVEHLPGVYSLYYHLDSLEVAEAQIVEQGQRLGTVGMTGLATGPHLHWELRVSGTAVDPDSLVRAPLIDNGRLSTIMEALNAELWAVEFFDPQEKGGD